MEVDRSEVPKRVAPDTKGTTMTGCLAASTGCAAAVPSSSSFSTSSEGDAGGMTLGSSVSAGSPSSESKRAYRKSKLSRYRSVEYVLKASHQMSSPLHSSTSPDSPYFRSASPTAPRTSAASETISGDPAVLNICIATFRTRLVQPFASVTADCEGGQHELSCRYRRRLDMDAPLP